MVVSPWRLPLRRARLCVAVHPPPGLLAPTSAGGQLQRQMSDGLISAPQLLSELLHLLQESLNLGVRGA